MCMCYLLCVGCLAWGGYGADNVLIGDRLHLSHLPVGPPAFEAIPTQYIGCEGLACGELWGWPVGSLGRQGRLTPDTVRFLPEKPPCVLCLVGVGPCLAWSGRVWPGVWPGLAGGLPFFGWGMDSVWIVCGRVCRCVERVWPCMDSVCVSLTLSCRRNFDVWSLSIDSRRRDRKPICGVCGLGITSTQGETGNRTLNTYGRRG